MVYYTCSICGLFVKVFILRKIRPRAISTYMALEVALDVLSIKTNHVTYVIGQICTCVLAYLWNRPTVLSVCLNVNPY